MLDSVHGKVLEIGLDATVVDVGGMALRLKVPPGSCRSLAVGSTARLYCHLLLRDEQFHLYGFARTEDRHAFTVLLSVSGLGPEKARALLGVMTPADVAQAVVDEDSKRFQVVKGIGARLAQRLALELKGKVDRFFVPGATGATSPDRDPPHLTDLIGALVQLGFQRSQAEAAAQSAVSEAPGESMEHHLRASIRVLQKPE